MKSKKTTIIISSIIVFLFIIGGAVFAVKALDQPSGSKREAVRRKQFQAKIPVKNQVRIKVSLLQNLKVLRPALIIIPVHRQVLRMFRLNGLRSA